MCLLLEALSMVSNFVCCVGWTTPEEVISSGDDHQLIAWNVALHEPSKLSDLPKDLYPTDLHCCPKSSKQQLQQQQLQQQKVSDVIVIGASDGKYHFVGRTGRLEKSVEAHNGAVLTVKWSNDGSALATSGEDGLVKVWSKSGMLRSTLSVSPVPTYCIAWSPKNDQILYTFDKNLIIKPLAPNSKPIDWKAHDGVVLKVDWNANNDLIISGGEDRRYKVWDSLGRVLFTSATHEHPITSLAWAPEGSLFAVGSYNTLKLCDKYGWSYSLDKPHIQSIFGLSWSSDSTQIAGACGNGNVIFAHVVDKRIEWKSYEVTVLGRKNISVKNVTTSSEDDLEFRDYVIKISFEFSNLIVITTSQCFIYKTNNWMSPHHFDLKDTSVLAIVQCDRHFLLIDSTNIGLYSYEARLIQNIKWIGMRIEALNSDTISLSSDTIAVRDANDLKVIHFIDTSNGKLINDGSNDVRHKLDITCVALNYCGPVSERICAFSDKNADIYLTLVRTTNTTVFQTIKLVSMAKCFIWNNDSNILAAIRENNRLSVWIYPMVAFVDSNLLSMAVIDKDGNDFDDKSPQLISFLNNRLSIRRSDGSLISSSINPFVNLLHTYAGQQQWPEALRLCQFLKDNYDIKALWAALAGMAVHSRQLNTAELAYAAVNRVDKVMYIQKLKELKDNESKNAEIALICGNIREAENLLIQSGYILRVIALNLQLFRWERALQLAKQYDKNNKFVELVLAYRQRYLEKADKKETLESFRQLLSNDEIELSDWDVYQERLDNPYDHKIAVQPLQSSQPTRERSRSTSRK
ncbi:intraflagellar transport protein 80 homolog [Oppia nitens]|uniref:intraflagellar transport protein 80 homolog n=1 Tax=Oppia nitens TaxID=1686743 RepID=UPI0023DB8F87|nr:intraflagellar transport protein 80 homolog [Oppia nitens]